MKGLELARKYYEEYGKPMLEQDFADTLPYLAVGLVGSGSECLGYDDELSEDHDFEPGFCIFLPGEDVVDRKEAFRLERAYAKLPKQFMGYRRAMMSPVGGSRHGVIRTADFYREKTGIDLGSAAAPGGGLTPEQWLHIPSYALKEATAGEVFEDHYGEFTRIRDDLSILPLDVRLKKLAGHVLLMAQSGQYNYPRIAQRGEKAAAQMAAFEFVKNTLAAIFLLNDEHMPYYKWSFRALRDLYILSDLEEPLYALISTGSEEELAKAKYEQIEAVCARLIEALKEQGLTQATCGDLEKHAYSINDLIEDGGVRNLNILYAV